MRIYPCPQLDILLAFRYCSILALTVNLSYMYNFVVFTDGFFILTFITFNMELSGDTVIVLASQVVFFMVGWIFFVKMLFKDYELHHMLVQLIFCINFTLSCTMFELIIFEIVDFLDIGSRYLQDVDS